MDPRKTKKRDSEHNASEYVCTLITEQTRLLSSVGLLVSAKRYIDVELSPSVASLILWGNRARDAKGGRGKELSHVRLSRRRYQFV